MDTYHEAQLMRILEKRRRRGVLGVYDELTPLHTRGGGGGRGVHNHSRISRDRYEPPPQQQQQATPHRRASSTTGTQTAEPPYVRPSPAPEPVAPAPRRYSHPSPPNYYGRVPSLRYSPSRSPSRGRGRRRSPSLLRGGGAWLRDGSLPRPLSPPRYRATPAPPPLLLPSSYPSGWRARSRRRSGSLGSGGGGPLGSPSLTAASRWRTGGGGSPLRLSSYSPHHRYNDYQPITGGGSSGTAGSYGWRDRQPLWSAEDRRDPTSNHGVGGSRSPSKSKKMKSKDAAKGRSRSKDRASLGRSRPQKKDRNRKKNQRSRSKKSRHRGHSSESDDDSDSDSGDGSSGSDIDSSDDARVRRDRRSKSRDKERKRRKEKRREKQQQQQQQGSVPGRVRGGSNFQPLPFPTAAGGDAPDGSGRPAGSIIPLASAVLPQYASSSVGSPRNPGSGVYSLGGGGGGGCSIARTNISQSQQVNPSQQVGLPDVRSTIDLRTSTKVLQAGDWFYKWNRQGSQVHPRWVWVDLQSYLFVWSHKETRNPSFSGSIKLETISQISPSELVQADEEGLPKTYYVLMIETAKRVLQLATERKDKMDIWFEALNNVIVFVRRKDILKGTEIPD